MQGKVCTDTNANGKLNMGEPGVSGRTVITVNVADFADTQRTATGAHRYYSLELAVETYLAQVEGTASFAYVSVTDGSTTIQHLGV